jgi:uncharacterized ferredoxin-like protein
MSNEEQIEELKKLVEEERAQRRAIVKRYQAKPEAQELARARDIRRRARRQVQRQQKRLVENELKAGRPKPLRCEICTEEAKKIVFDHSHLSNKFRGWLCNRCNVIIGQAGDNPILLEKLAVYLRTHDVK